MGYLSHLFLSNKAGIFLSCSVFIMTSLAGIISPILIKNIVDIGINQNRMDLCVIYAAQYLLCQFATIILGTLGLFLSERSANKILCNQKSRIIYKLLNMKYCSLDKKSPAELNLIINSYVDDIKFFFADFPRIMIELFFLIIGSFVFIGYINEKIIWFVFLAAAINGLVYVILQKKLNELARQKNDLAKEQEKWLQYIFKNAAEFLLNCGWTKVKSETSRIYSSSINMSNKQLDIDYVSSWISRVVSAVFTLLIYLVSDQGTTIGSVLATISFLGIILPLVNTCIDMIKYYTMLSPSIDEIMGIEKMITEEIHTPIKRNQDSDHVYNIYKLTFRYEQEYIFKDADITLPKNGIVVLQSKNGSGKTTLAKIVLGLLNVESGSTNMTEDKIAYLPQASVLFPDSIRFNITLSDKEVDSEEFRNYFGISGIDDFIFHGQRDMNALVPIDDNCFSGGEKRKICILRTLWSANKCDIIIMDEPEAGLDRKSNDILINILNHFAQHKLIVLITHSNFLKELGKKMCISDGKMYYEQ